MGKVLRVDFASEKLPSPVTLTDGSLRVSARIARTGVQVYRFEDGTEWREYRPPEEVFAKDSLESWDDLAVTVLHPSEPVAPSNWALLAKGHVDDPSRDGTFLAATCVVKDAATIQAIQAGSLVEVSCGYFMDIDVTPGVSPEGESYDAIQRNIVGNHVALGPVDWGRAGNDVRLYADSKDIVRGDSSRLRTDDYPKSMAQEIQNPTATPAEKVVPFAEYEKVAAERDALKVAAATAEAKIIEVTNSVDSIVAKRVGNIAAALKVKPTLDTSKTDREIMTEAIKVSDPTFVADGKSDEYLRARVDTANLAPAPKAQEENLRRQVEDSANQATNQPSKLGMVEDARRAMIEKNLEANRKPLNAQVKG